MDACIWRQIGDRRWRIRIAKQHYSDRVGLAQLLTHHTYIAKGCTGENDKYERGIAIEQAGGDAGTEIYAHAGMLEPPDCIA